MVNKIAVVLSENKTQKIVWTLLCVMPVLGMTVDLIAPSLPAIATGLQISPSMAKNVISVYLLGYALGNFFTGFLTDALGRKKLLLGGLGGFLIASLLPVFFPNITVLLLARFLQGVTIGGVSVVSRAIFSDVLPPEKLVRLGVLIGTMWGLGPVIGPLIGGYLQVYFERFEMERLLFIMINLFLVIAVVVMITSYFLPYSVSLIAIGSAMMFFGTGFIFPMSMGKGISLFRHIAGTATATMYLINVLITGLTSFVVSFLNIQSAISLMWLYFTLMLIAASVYWLMIRPASATI